MAAPESRPPVANAATAGSVSSDVVSARRFRFAGRRFLSPQVLQFALFAVNGAVVAVIYSIAVWSLISLSPRSFTFDVVIAYGISVVTNYLGARLIFRSATRMRTHVPRYLTVVALNFVLAAAVAWSLDYIGAPRIISAYAPVVVTAVPSFLLMRRWVFRPETSPTVS